MTKIKIQKIIFISLILVIFIISCIAYSFPDLFPTCFFLSNITAAFLFSNLLWIRPPYHDSIQKISLPQFLTASVIASVILFIYIGIGVYFLWHYPLSSITEPINCFAIIWGIAVLTFSALTLFSFTTEKIYQRRMKISIIKSKKR